ncbi:hypothetical protein L208DRAFT_1377117 [Tricholoma matsutake]|nr:hypothetical protein L208DRAFT_1377117 [Tricholoma matsutake 945]
MGTISAKFFLPKGKSKTIQFTPNKVLELYLELAYNRYAEILGHLEDMEDEPMHLPNQQMKKMSISYITEMEGHDALLPRSSDDSPPPTPFVGWKQLRKCQLSKVSVMSPPHAKVCCGDHPVTDLTMPPNTQPVQQALEAQTAPSKCNVKSISFMEMVYSFVDEYIEAHSAPTFTIPRMRFVKSTLTISDATCEMYMIEEVIDEASNEMFVKYIGNGSILQTMKTQQLLFTDTPSHVHAIWDKEEGEITEVIG